MWKELEIDDRWSHKFYGKKSSLDQIVLPKQMFDGKGIDYVNNSFKVYKADYLFTKRGYINRWRYKNGKHIAKGYSDHLPIFAYFDVKPYVADKDQKAKKSILRKLIDYFYTINSLECEILLEDVVVVYKRGRDAIIKQSKKGRGIILYGCAGKLKEGYKYDLGIEAIKEYRGLKEITHLYVLKNKGRHAIKNYCYQQRDILENKLQQNEVLCNIAGTYKNRFLYMDGQKIPIYFKKKKLTPKNGSKLKIDYAHLGYYKKLQLVVYSKKDFTVRE